MSTDPGVVYSHNEGVLPLQYRTGCIYTIQPILYQPHMGNEKTCNILQVCAKVWLFMLHSLPLNLRMLTAGAVAA